MSSEMDLIGLQNNKLIKVDCKQLVVLEVAQAFSMKQETKLRHSQGFKLLLAIQEELVE